MMLYLNLVLDMYCSLLSDQVHYGFVTIPDNQYSLDHATTVYLFLCSS